MTYSQFGIGLLVSVIFAVAGCWGLHTALEVDYALPVTIGMGILLGVICTLMFWLGKRTAGAENKFLFGNIFMGMTGVKMLFCAGVLVSYIFIADPPNALFVLPVFFVYLVFTVLEVVSLVRLSREAK